MERPPEVEDQQRIYRAAELREIDRRATEEFGIPPLLLMENAALALADVAAEQIASAPGPVVVFAGPGNNGGDGLCAARHLHNRGFDVRIVLAAPPESFRGEAGLHLRIARSMGLPVSMPDEGRGDETAAVVIDALFGTGLSRPLEGAAAECARRIGRLRAAGARVVSADVPSGLQSDSGEVLGGLAVRADVTVTFVGHKPAFRLRPDLVGPVVVAGIGAPRELIARYGSAAGDAAASPG